ncbi:zinc/iron regulated transporter-related protein [Elysia marginata]|uniref:Zinc/iron regulated transporter-related protein n=1 Tax=Elysia marginata TaxID=1093978 RepID=A0AAV4HHD0_9GAST|nr:zinc/iron regulated transporter-related protein [Elysia marginata]
MEADDAKAICIVALFLDTLLFGWPPYFLVRAKAGRSDKFNRIRKSVISYLTCFSGGVFLGACLLHLLPEGLEKVDEYFQKEGVDAHFPVFEALIAGGFFLIALIEQLAHKLLHSSSHAHTHCPEVAKSTSARLSAHEIEDKSSVALTQGSQSMAIATMGAQDERREEETKVVLQANHSVIPINAECELTSRRSTYNGYSVAASSDQSVTRHECIVPSVREPEHSHENEMVQALKVSEANPFRALLLLIAMSFHTIFDGLAVGLMSEVSDVWQMFGAICIHKSLITLCLGTELFLVYAKKPLRAFLTIFVFALITPFGVGE